MENYFNYFTEIEEHFWKKRGTSLLLTTLDWALIETWKESAIPLEAVLRGIDRAFEKHEKRRHKVRMVNSLAYCQQAVLEAAQEKERTSLQHTSTKEPFEREELEKFFTANAAAVNRTAEIFEQQSRPESAAALRGIVRSLNELAAGADGTSDLEDIERRLTVLEEKMFSILLGAADEAEMFKVREEMDRSLAPVRHKMSSDQIALLQKQYVHRALLEKAALPRLSLFYL